MNEGESKKANKKGGGKTFASLQIKIRVVDPGVAPEVRAVPSFVRIRTWGKVITDSLRKASFIWWWVFGLATNFAYIVLLPYPIISAFQWVDEHGATWFSDTCQATLGTVGCLLLVITVIWWVVLIAIILGLVLRLLFNIWWLVGIVLSLGVTYLIGRSLVPEDAYRARDYFNWFDFLAAIGSLPLAYFVFAEISTPASTPKIISEVFASMLPDPFQNSYFILLGVIAWALTWMIFLVINSLSRQHK